MRCLRSLLFLALHYLHFHPQDYLFRLQDYLFHHLVRYRMALLPLRSLPVWFRHSLYRLECSLQEWYLPLASARHQVSRSRHQEPSFPIQQPQPQSQLLLLSGHLLQIPAIYLQPLTRHPRLYLLNQSRGYRPFNQHGRKLLIPSLMV